MKLTEHFDSTEFYCKDGTPCPNQYAHNLMDLAENLEVLRVDIGVPIHINSGYRTPAYNAQIGGEPKSKHKLGMAADITAKGFTPKRLADRIELLIAQGKMLEGGLGRYKTFTHYDVRGTKARWSK